jgi:hypothetical protein
MTRRGVAAASTSFRNTAREAVPGQRTEQHPLPQFPDALAPSLHGPSARLAAGWPTGSPTTIQVSGRPPIQATVVPDLLAGEGPRLQPELPRRCVPLAPGRSAFAGPSFTWVAAGAWHSHRRKRGIECHPGSLSVKDFAQETASQSLTEPRDQPSVAYSAQLDRAVHRLQEETVR